MDVQINNSSSKEAETLEAGQAQIIYIYIYIYMYLINTYIIHNMLFIYI